MGWSLTALPPLILAVGLIQLSYCDITRRLLPKTMVYGLTGIVVASSIAVAAQNHMWERLKIATIGGLVFFAIFLIINLMNPRWMAFGDVRLSLDLDGSGTASIHTGVGFLDHMLDLLSRHSLIDLTVEAEGDLQVDAHHTVEDVGIVLGAALEKALGEKRGINRYGWAIVPMDESLAQVAIDLSSRPAFVFSVASGSPFASWPIQSWTWQSGAGVPSG